MPKLPQEKAEYIGEFSQLNGTWLVDFPGMFESKGLELDIALDLTLQRVLQRSKSAKLVLLVPATILEPSINSLITKIKERLEHMFKDPAKNIPICLTKSRMQ